MEQTELLALIEKSRAGDPDAQEKLVIEAQNRVYYHCKKFLKNEEDAQDATQDVLITMITSLDKLREPAAFWGWVNGITANRCKHLLTQGTKEWQIPEDEEGNSMLESIETLDDQTVPDKAIDNAETQRLVMEIIDGLPAEQRMTVTFFYYDEMSVKEIAKAMEVSEGTVKSRLNYARKSIKLEVEKLEKKDGTKLYSVSILPFLLYFFRRNAQSQTLSPAAASAITQGTLAGAGTTATTGAVAAAGGVAAKAGLGLGAKIIAGVLAGTLAVGGIGTAAYVTTRREPEPTPTPVPVVAEVTPTPTPTPTLEITPTPEASEEPSPTPEASEEPTPSEEPSPTPEATPEPTPEPSPEPTPTPAYLSAYAQKVEELDGKLGKRGKYALCYIDGDNVPELVVVEDGYQMSIYTYAGDQIYTVLENQIASRLGFPVYYPYQNAVVEQYSSMANDHMEGLNAYFRIGADHTLQEVCTESWTWWGDADPGYISEVTPEGATPPSVSGESVPLDRSLMTAQALLDSLE